MKAALFTLIALGVSTSAMACPNLAGTWICQYQDGTSDSSTVTQAAMTGGEMYTISSSEGQQQLPATGQSYSVTDQGLPGTLVVNCQDDTAVNALEQVAGAAGSDDAGVAANVNLTYALTAANAMSINAVINITEDGQPTETQTQTATCTRN